MSIICKLLGHKPLTNDGYARGVGYARVILSETDNINRTHLYLQAKCPRCGAKYHICNVHVPKTTRSDDE